MIYRFDRILRGMEMAAGIKVEANSLSTARRRARQINKKGLLCGCDRRQTLIDDKNTVLKLRKGAENE